MRLLTIGLLSITLHAATFYISSAGSDSNTGSQANPWLTLNHAVNSVGCGDTINIVADGSFVAGDTSLPAFSNCGKVTTVQSSRLAQFAPIGYRTNPANDSAIYGKLSFTSQGIKVAPGVFTFNTSASYAAISFNGNWGTIIGGSGLTAPNLANGSQVELENIIAASNYGGPIFPNITPPGGLSFLTHYYVVNCQSGPSGSVGFPQTCGQPNSTFQFAASPGGTPIALGSCGLYCETTVTTIPAGACTAGQMQYNSTNSTTYDCPTGVWAPTGRNFIFVGVPTAADTTANTLTIPNNYGPGALSNGLAVTFSAVGFQLFGALPDPLQPDQIYYVQNLSGRTFQVASVPGGPIIPIATVGTGMINTASVPIAQNWAFRGLELAPNGASQPFYFFEFGQGSETSFLGMTSHMEVDRCYLHDNPPHQGIGHSIIDNGTFISIHDSWIIGANILEAQAIFGAGSPGPTIISNNFLEADGEVTLYGGDWPASGVANANKLFIGNYFYKPPIWKIWNGTGTISGPCFYDATDPTHAGGEWYRDTSAGQNYQCGSNGLWAATASPLPVYPNGISIKNMTEHKNGRYFSYIGNLYNYSISQDQSGEVWNNSMEFGSGPGAANDHITVMNNAAFNVFSFTTRANQCGVSPDAVCPIHPGNHVTVNNLVVLNPLTCGVGNGSQRCGFANHSTADVGQNAPYFNDDYWSHNTVWAPEPYPAVGPPYGGLTPLYVQSPTGGNPPYSPLPVNRTIYKNSLALGDMGGDGASGGAIVSGAYGNSIFSNNALKGAVGSYASVGASNSWTNIVYPSNNAAIGFVPGADGTIAGDYHLAATSPYSAANGTPAQLASDGTDLGADIDVVNMATSGAAAGTPPWDRLTGLRVNPGSSQVVFRYTAPSAAACTATIYGAPARVAANQVALVADSSANSISDALARELYISGLHPSTQYWYKLACGGGVLMVGDLLTRATGQGTVPFSFDWSSPTSMQYSSSRNMSNPVSLPPATRQFVPVAANSAVYVQTGAAGPITLLIAP